MQFDWEEKYTIAMQPNMLSPQAVEEIKTYLRDQVGSIEWKYWDWSWNIEPGKGSIYVGKLPGRIAAYLNKSYEIKLGVDTSKTIGDIAKKHMPSVDTVALSFSKNVDWQAGKFGDKDSCFWGNRKDCRDNIKSNNGFSVQAWTADGKPLSRVWGALEEKSKLLVIYNAYGTLSISQFARALAEKYDCDYRMVSLTAGGSREKIVYINNTSGYVIGEAGDLDLFTGSGRYDLKWKVKVVCTNCRKFEETTNFDGRAYCLRCYATFVKDCGNCGRKQWYAHLTRERTQYGSTEYKYLCGNCINMHCPDCGNNADPIWFHNDYLIIRKCLTCRTRDMELLNGILEHA